MIDYIELHSHSYFSLLDGASSPEDLVQRAAALGMSHLALTDHDAVYGAPQFVKSARKAGVKPILGAELTLHDDSHLTLLVQNETGWHNLCALISAARHNAPKGEARLPDDGLEGYTDGLIALSGCHKGQVPAALLKGKHETALESGRKLKRLFGAGQFWIELQHHLHPKDDRLMADLAELAGYLGIGMVATNNVHYATPERHELQDVLQCIQQQTSLDEAINLRFNSEFYLKSGNELVSFFGTCGAALQNTCQIANLCDFELTNGLQELPVYPTPERISTDQYLRQLCVRQANRLELASEAFDQIDYELRVIRESGLSNYFLIVWDIVRFAREQKIACQGRGSAANSLVAYLLDISPINPLAHNLVFERFLSSERQVVPDIDIDFDSERREEVIQYIYRRYGLDHAAMACTFVTFQARSAIRDIGKSLGLPVDMLGHVTSTLDSYHADSLCESVSLQESIGSRIGDQTWQHILTLSEQIDSFPRHLGIHNGGMIITGAPIHTRLPTEPATMTDRFVTQWDKEGLEDAGMVKIDILGLRMLSAVSDAVRLTGEDVSGLSYDDPAVYDMICAADTVGVFQVESRAQAQVLPRLKPRLFADLIVSISLIRPGPVQGNMVHPYLNRRDGLEEVDYFHPLLEDALKETLGVILFQEQCLKVAQSLAEFTPGQGELLRRALGSKHAQKAVENLHEAFVAGAVEKGVDRETAEMVFDRLRAFGSYSFAKSHAASFAVLVYRSAWLKRYYPAAFAVALLNNQPMGFWSPAIILSDIRRHGIVVYPVNVNRSQYKCTLEGQGIRLGINYVRDFGEEAANRILDARQERPFSSLEDFCRRVDLPTHLVENLIAGGGMDSWGQSRRDLLWAAGLQQKSNALGLSSPAEPVRLPVLNQAEKAGMEYHATGLSMGPHPLMFYRSRLQQRGILNSAQLGKHPDGQQVWVAGLIVVHQSPPTAKGFHFITLEDEYGFMNLIVRPKTYVRFRRVIRSASLLLARGQVQREGAVTNLIVSQVSPLTGQSNLSTRT